MEDTPEQPDAKVSRLEKDSEPELTGKTLAQLMQWLKELDEEQKRLQEIEKQFLKTRDIELLKEFFSASTGGDPIILKTPINEPYALGCAQGYEEIMKMTYGEDWLKCEFEIAKRLNPNVIKVEAEDIKGRKFIVYVGVEGKEHWLLQRLWMKERNLEIKKQQGTEVLNSMLQENKNKKQEYKSNSLPIQTPFQNKTTNRVH